ncbi:hypothetical protein HPB52_002119 [Rhipicephalus sanguineus]|uniref:Uncharacterized protein n=2 Tax=Rhipicephalus sanguineus TaxID=34632 RepID=A0A9D4QEY9_RHISA|nr:hypothetical protein HPB52_002119 [Rhipicephalus sanguineus]
MRANSTTQLIQAFRSGNALSREHKELWIQKTPIKSFRAGVLGNFKFERVHLERNANLSYFTLDSLMNFNGLLNVLSVYGNALRTFEFDKLPRFPNLFALNLGGNRLTSIPDNAFRNPHLQKLGLRENPITSIGRRAFYALSSLKELDLSHTRLATLGPLSLSILRTHPELRIQLHNAGIRAINPNAFDHAAPLVLNLGNNSLASLERNPFEPLILRMYQNARQLGTLPIISVAGNPLTCRGCSYRWLVQYRFSAQVRAILHGFQCPDGYGLSSISDQRIDCWDPWNFASIG